METSKVKRVRIVKVWAGDVMTATFHGYDVDGKNLGPVAGVEPVTMDTARLSPENRINALKHGIEQKIGDAAALGQLATVAEKRAEMAAIAERLETPEGTWNVKTGRGPISAEALIAKLVALGYDVSKKAGPVVDVTPQG